MNVASIQAGLFLSQQGQSVKETGGDFAQNLLSMMMQIRTAPTETQTEETKQVSQEELQSLLQILSIPSNSNESVDLLSLLTGSDDHQLDLDSFMLVKQEDIPFEILSFLQAFTGMETNELLEWISSQSGVNHEQELLSFFNLARIASTIEGKISNEEPPTQAVVKMLEILKAVELAGSRITLPPKESKAYEQLKQSLTQISESLQSLINPKRQQVFAKAYESFRAITVTHNEDVHAKASEPAPNRGMDLAKVEVKSSSSEPIPSTPLLTRTKQALNDGSVKVFDGNVSFLSNVKQPILANTQTQPSSKPLTFQQFTEMLSKMMQKSQFSESNGTQRLFIRLHPEHLGTLRIEIMKQDGILTAKLLASTQAAKDMIDTQLQGLRNTLGYQQIQVEKMETADTWSQHQQERFSQNKDQQKQHPGSQHQPKKDNEQNEHESEDFQSVLFELIV